MPNLVRTAIAVAVFAAAIVPSQAQAQRVIDQSQVNGFCCYTFTSVWEAQSFVPGANNVAGAGFHITASSRFSGTSHLDISLWSALPTEEGARMLASGASAPFTFAGNGGSFWADAFWNPVGVSEATTYFIVFASPASTGLDVLSEATGGTSYASGQAWNQQIVAGNPTSDVWNASPGWDFTFREYSSTEFSATPEPGSVILLATGFAGIGLATRKRRRR